MSYSVFLWSGDYPCQFGVQYAETNVDLGGGVVKTAMSEIPQYREDGTGRLASHKGTKFVTVRLQRKNYSGDEQFKSVQRFLMARKEANNEPFYFYLPWITATPDPTGVETAGRLIVKFLGKIDAVLEHLQRFNYADLVFMEARDAY